MITDSRASTSWGLRGASFVFFLLLPLLSGTSSFAEIYKYQTDDGEVVYSSEKRSDLKLVEVIGESKPASKVSNTATKTSKPRKSSSSDAYDGLIREAAQTYELPFEFIKAVIKVESNFN
ncbi:MAG: DUF4124 domain-containing protein, partial [Myxococcota bacterium]|nr:DUF4124 domain-containing protein [Myxococcota bacterium]